MMKSIIDDILTRVKAVQNEPDFLNTLFAKTKDKALAGAPIVLFGAGAFGKEMLMTLRREGLFPCCFCDNYQAREFAEFCGIPVIDFSELLNSHRQSLVVIASQRYRQDMVLQLIDAGFNKDLLFCTENNLESDLIVMYAMVGTQVVLAHCDALEGGAQSLLINDRKAIEAAYNLLSDEKSKQLFISKLALMVSGHYALFRKFMLDFSEPLLQDGPFGRPGSTEDHYYFNNDFLPLEEGEVYVDVGAYDGDSIQAFVTSCQEQRINYGQIFAFEPDPICFSELLESTVGLDNVRNERLGLWSESTTLRFIDSEQAIHDQAGMISAKGTVKISVMSLDDYLLGEKITFLKMDPSGDVIPEVLLGARNTIERNRPKIVAGVYHNFDSIYKIPLLLKGICPDYRIVLRHNTYHLCDTDLYAMI